MTTTLEDIIIVPEALDLIYKMCVAHNQNNYVLENAHIKIFSEYIETPILQVSDEILLGNSGTYTCDEIGLLKYRNGTFKPIGIQHYDEWKTVTCTYNKTRQLD